MNGLSLSFLPTKVRGTVYGAAVVLGLIVAAAQGGYTAIGEADPVWLAFAAGALVPVSIAAGVLAASNLTPTVPPVDADVVEVEPALLETGAPGEPEHFADPDEDIEPAPIPEEGDGDHPDSRRVVDIG